MRFAYLLLLVFLACSSTADEAFQTNDMEPQEMSDNEADTNNEENSLYFPPTGSDSWETLSPESLNWNAAAIAELEIFLQENNTKAFIILKEGKIVMESYFQGSNAMTNHPWYSAGKTLTAHTIGIAQAENFLSIDDASSDYLGTGWTSMTLMQEEAIKIRNQLTMTSGGDFSTLNWNCTDPECLEYLSPAGSYWFYYNAYYTLLQNVVANATNTDFNSYFNSKLRNPIGMDGNWISLGYSRVYFSTARSMARFGLLNLRKGKWKDLEILDLNFYEEMSQPSQSLNPAYGYLWWLNGQEYYRLPASTQEFEGKLIPNAPDDLIAGLGKNDQKMYVIPSLDMVVVRLGDSASMELLGPSSFDNQLWAQLNAVIN